MNIKKYLNISRVEGGIEFDKMPGVVEDYSMTERRKRRRCK